MGSREAVLMGRLTAGMTHEMKNVLAIIKESSGLLQDILRLSKGDLASKREQIEKLSSRIQAQVARGNEQIGSLNWLAHSMSDRSSSVGIRELSTEIVKLMQRLARAKQIALEVEPTDRDVTIHTDLPQLLVLLAGCIEYHLERESAQGRVLLRPGKEGGEATLEILTESTAGAGTIEKTAAEEDRLPSGLADLEPLLGSLGVRLAFTAAGGGTKLRFMLPLARDEDR